MRRDYTLRATPRPPSLPPLAPLVTNPKPITRRSRLHTGAAGLAAASAAFILPVCVAAVMGLPWFAGLAAWAANIVLAVVLSATAPPPEYRAVVPRRTSSYEPGGMGAYYAFQDWASGGDCGGDGGAC